MNDCTLIIDVDPGRATAILDIRTLDYYEIQQGVLQQRLSKYYIQ